MARSLTILTYVAGGVGVAVAFYYLERAAVTP